ncbi:MAG: helix-turn-helix domain-containing protein [Burkholderiaceae bacterium]
MFSIGDLSKRTGVKIPTIRYYEQLGLIAADGRSEGNQRRYGDGGLARLSFIRHARELGFSIEDIRELTALSVHPERSCGDAHAIATRHLRAIRERMARLSRLERELERIVGADGGRVADCAVIETLADHGQCLDEH